MLLLRLRWLLLGVAESGREGLPSSASLLSFLLDDNDTAMARQWLPFPQRHIRIQFRLLCCIIHQKIFHQPPPAAISIISVSSLFRFFHQRRRRRQEPVTLENGGRLVKVAEVAAAHSSLLTTGQKTFPNGDHRKTIVPLSEEEAAALPALPALVQLPRQI